MTRTKDQNEVHEAILEGLSKKTRKIPRNNARCDVGGFFPRGNRDLCVLNNRK